ncbi:MAG: galactokinase [Candidatus Nanopelagicaceae bacterium]|nr:galactokinase [Candidatus Nanopelagicaceae bacterium]
MEIVQAFETSFGAKPEVVAQAPGRVNLIGEHIDYSQGFVLPFAIDAVTRSAIRKRDDGQIRIVSAQHPEAMIRSSISELREKGGTGWSRYILGVLWALEIENGLDIYVDGRVPLGAGLSSSAALECSVATAINHLFELGKSLTQLAQLTQRAENQYVGVPCGIMDQSVSLMAKGGYALLLDCRDLSTQHIPVDFAGAGLRLLIVDTRADHALIDGGYAERRASCESAAAKLGVVSMRDLDMQHLESQKDKLTAVEFQRARHAVSEIARVLNAVERLRTKQFVEFGELLNQSHISLRDDYKVSCPELDLVVDTANANGALGARMVGGGFGGSAIALIKDEDAGKISLAIEKAFAEAGYQAPRFFDSLPSDGAKLIS